MGYPLYTINYQFSLPPVQKISNIIFHNIETEDINIPKHSDIFTIQFPSRYPIALIQTTQQSLTLLYKNSIDTSTQNTRMTLLLITSNLLNTFQHPKEAEETTLTITDTDDDNSKLNEKKYQLSRKQKLN